MSYDIKFRKRVLEFMDEGHTYAQAYEAFKIFPTVIVAWRKLLAKTGALEPQKYKHKPKKIDPEKLKKAIEKKPDSYLRELAAKFNCSISAIHKQLVKNNITYKKNIHVCRKIRRETKKISKES
jgi:transposase